jgi:Protein of unknown function (DUF3040)
VTPRSARDNGVVPLSEDEQRILSEIESQLRGSDPELVDTVSRTTVYRHALRAIRWAAVGFIVGLVVVVATFTSNLFVAFIGFLAMLASLIVVSSNVKKIGKAGLHSLFGIREGGLRRVVSDAGQAWRDRFRRDS